MERLRRTIITGVLAALMAAVCTPAQAQDSDETRHWMVDMDLGFNTDGYDVQLGVSWWPVQGFGVKMAIGLAGELEQFAEWDWLYDDYYYDDYAYSDYAVRVKLMPSLELRSPSLLRWHDGDNALRLFGNPGLCLSPGAAGSRDADWLSWQLRGGLEMDISDVVLKLGYSYSDFNLYSGDPVSHYPLPDKRERKTHGGFLSVGIRF